MKICWDNIENIRYYDGKWYDNSIVYVYKESCEHCKEPFLAQKHSKAKFCSISCGLKGNDHNNWIKTSEGRKLISRKAKERYKNNPQKHPMFEKNHSLEAKRKMSKAHLGKIISDETKKKWSEIRSGEGNSMFGKFGSEHPAWKGGVSKFPYCFEFTKDLKEYIKYRDGYKCQNFLCYSKYPDDLCVHHIDYNKMNCVGSNLITLCRCCNSMANKDREWHVAFYKGIIRRKIIKLI